MNYEEAIERLLEPENIAVSRALSLYEVRERNNGSTTIPRQKLKAFLQVADTRRRVLKDERGRKALHEILRQRGRIRKGSNLEKTLSGRDTQGVRLSDGTYSESGNEVKIPGEFGSLYEHPIVKELLKEIKDEQTKGKAHFSLNLNSTDSEHSGNQGASSMPGSGNATDPSSNSTPSLLQRVRNILAGRVGSDTVKYQYRQRMTEMLGDALGVKIRYGKLSAGDGKNTVVYKERDKVIRSAHAYDWENILPVAGGTRGKTPWT